MLTQSFKVFKKPAALLLVTAFMVGCATQSTKESGTPAWLNQTPTAPGHVYGLGSAQVYVDKVDAINRAGDQARVAMIQKLRVTMTGEVSQGTYSKRVGGKETELIQELNQQVSSKIPEVQLDDIEIAESYVDESANIAYALAHLDRNQASAKIRREMTNIEFELEAMKTVPTTGTKLEQIQQLMPALGKFHQLDALAERLQLVSPTGNNAPLDPSLQELKARIYALIDSLVIQVEPSVQANQRIQDRLVSQLTQKGFRVDPNQSPDLRISYNAEFRDVEKNGTHYVFADGYVNILDDQGKILSALNTKVKGASGYAELAENYAVKDLADQMGEKVANTLLKNL